MNFPMTEQERHTIIAALQSYLNHGYGDPANRTDEIHYLATNAKQGEEDGPIISLDESGVQDLLDRLKGKRKTLITKIDWEKKSIWFYSLDVLLSDIGELNIGNFLSTKFEITPNYYHIQTASKPDFDAVVNLIKRYERGIA